MSKFRRDAVIVTCGIVFAWFATPWARIGWYDIAVPKSYSSTLMRLDYAFLAQWAFELLWGAAFGASLTRLLRSRGAFWWSLAFGVGLGLLNFALTSWRFAAEAPPSVYVWVYGQFPMPVIGAALASWAVAKYWPGHRPRMPNTA